MTVLTSLQLRRQCQITEYFRIKSQDQCLKDEPWVHGWYHPFLVHRQAWLISDHSEKLVLRYWTVSMCAVGLIPADRPARAQGGDLPSPAANVATFSLQLDEAEAKRLGYFIIAIGLKLTVLFEWSQTDLYQDSKCWPQVILNIDDH